MVGVTKAEDFSGITPESGSGKKASAENQNNHLQDSSENINIKFEHGLELEKPTIQNHTDKVEPLGLRTLQPPISPTATTTTTENLPIVKKRGSSDEDPAHDDSRSDPSEDEDDEEDKLPGFDSLEDLPIIPGVVLNGSDVDSAFEDTHPIVEERRHAKNNKKRPSKRDPVRGSGESSLASNNNSLNIFGEKLRRSQMDLMDLEIEPISKLIVTPGEDHLNSGPHWLYYPEPTQFNLEISPLPEHKHGIEENQLNTSHMEIMEEQAGKPDHFEGGDSTDKEPGGLYFPEVNIQLVTVSEPQLSPEQPKEEGPRKDSQIQVEDEDEYELVPPDGGWGWMVLFGAIIVNILIPGQIKSFGVLFAEFLEVFNASPSAASWIPAISYCLYSSMGLFASALALRFSERSVTIFGGLLASAGLMSSYFANSIVHLYISYGLIGGLGAGLAYPIGIFIVGKYFDKRRGLANGLCTSGSALGSVLIPPLLRYLLNHFGYRGAILIMGIILLNVCIGALFYSPIEKHMKRIPIPRTQAKTEESANSAPSSLPVQEADKTNHIEIRKIKSESRFPTRREIAQSMPIAIPMQSFQMMESNREIRDRRGSENVRKATFHIGHDTPQDSWTPRSTRSNDGTTSPLIVRMMKEEEAQIYSPKLSGRGSRTSQLPNGDSKFIESDPLIGRADEGAPNSLLTASGGQSRQNLTAIPEDEDSETPTGSRKISASFASALPTNPRSLRLSMSGGGIQAMFSANNQTGLSRTLSMASNVSNSSFHYISTIHHGGALSALNLDRYSSSMNLRSSAKQQQRRDTDEALREDAREELFPRKKKQCSFVRSIVDFSLFKDGMFIIMLLSNAMSAISYTNFILLLPAYALKLGFNKDKATLLLSVVAAFDFVGRIGGAAISDLRFFPRKWFYIVGLFFSGLTLSFISMAQTYTAIVMICSCFGLFSGIYIGVTAVILADFLGPERLGSSYGITLFINGILQLMGPPICGLLLNFMGYEPVLSGLGGILMCGSFFWFASPCVERRQRMVALELADKSTQKVMNGNIGNIERQAIM